jgi:hypothetical protein
MIFTVAFTLETATKSIGMGFSLDKGSYMRETWNQLDCFIVITSIIDASLSGVELPIIKILRLLRILRPLRFISHNSAMKNIVIALLSSMGAIVNVGIVVGIIYLMFAIMGVNMFGGKFQYCTVDTNIIETKDECESNKGKWKTYHSNFDTVPGAMLTLFIVASQEGWPDIMF